MAELKTRIVLRNDSTANWLSNEDVVLLKGEVGIEFLSGGKVKMKIGDGAKSWAELPYFGGEDAHVYEALAAKGGDHVTAITGALNGNTPNSHDVAIVKEEIIAAEDLAEGVEQKYQYTAYRYNGTNWVAMDGNYSAENVYFDDDILVTTKIGTIQTLTNGQATLSAKGKNLKTVLSSLMAERKNPTATVPSGTVELTNNNNKNYSVEIGTSVTPTWKTTFSAGSYTYGPATGVTATAATVALSTDSNNTAAIDAGAMNNKTGSLAAFTVADTTKHYVKVTYGWNAGTTTPVDNFGDAYTNEANNLPIKAASNKSDTSTYYITGYRKAFYGSKTSAVELNSNNLRGLASSDAASGTVSVTVVEGAKQVIIAVPSNRKVTKVADEGAFGTDIFSEFVPTENVQVGGADATAENIGEYATGYTVYVYSPSTALGANTYTVTLANK